MAVYSSVNSANSMHPAGHTMGDFPKKTSIGNGKRKATSYKRSKKYCGQGKR